MKKIFVKKSKNILKKILKKIFLIIILLTTIWVANSLQFSEVMYNPQGSDTGREWIELSNPECENLGKYKLVENNINHNIMLYSEGVCDYIIICDDCARFLDDYNVSSALYESSFTLSNTGEFIALTYNDSIIDYVNYTGMENIEGMSISRHDGYWIHSTPTPGEPIIMNATINQTLNQSDNQTTNITLNQTSNQTINNTINNTGNNYTGNITQINITENIEKCNVTIGIKIKEEKDIYYNKDPIKFYNTINVTPSQKTEFYIEYWIEDIYGNILKNKVQTNNLNEKTYTPNINEKTVVALFKNRIINLTCVSGEENIINETSEKIIIIKNPEYKEKECEKCPKCDSEIYVEKESQLKTSIEENILKIEAYRGNDRKYVINTAIKNEKKRNIMTPIRIGLEKYSGMTIDIPIMIGSCGEYRIITEGLGFIEEKEYLIECENVDEKELKKEDEKNSDENIKIELEKQDMGQKESKTTENVSQFFHNRITGETIYESRNEETKKYSLMGTIVLIAGSTIYTAYKLFIAKKNTPKDL